MPKESESKKKMKELDFRKKLRKQGTKRRRESRPNKKLKMRD